MCKGIAKSLVIVLAVMWIGFWVPEFMDAQIIPRYGAGPGVWWAFPWIMTVIVLLVIAMINFAIKANKCIKKG